MATNIEELREQAENLTACLERLREGAGGFSDPTEARWLESMLASSLATLRSHIIQLEQLEYRDPMRSIIFRKGR